MSPLSQRLSSPFSISCRSNLGELYRDSLRLETIGNLDFVPADLPNKYYNNIVVVVVVGEFTPSM